MNRGLFRVAVTLFVILLSATLPVGVSGDNPLPTPGLPHSLSLRLVPPVLPADGAVYPSLVVTLVDSVGVPSVSLNDTSVYLSSSQPNVGRVVNASVVIPTGKFFVVAKFETTKNAGVTQVTASSTGLLSATTNVATARPSGYPTQLIVSPIPNTVWSAGQKYQGTLLLELVDDNNLPAKAVVDTQVSLFSSNSKVLNLTDNSITIPSGDFLHLTSFVTNFVPGYASVTASSAEYAAGSATVLVLGPPPLSLKLYAQPDRLVQCQPVLVKSCVGRLVIALVDSTGQPARAPRPIIVQIRSTNTGSVSAPETAIIPSGSIATIANYTARWLSGTFGCFSAPRINEGCAQITVSSPGLQSDFASIVTYPPVGGPASLRLFVGPNPVLADHNSYSSVVVSLINASGFPTINGTAPRTRITITSSHASIGNFSTLNVYVPSGRNFAATGFTSTFLIGSTDLTASAQNLLPAQSSLATFGSIPSKVRIRAVPSAQLGSNVGTLPADGGTHPALEISLLDALGSPAVAPFPVPVTISSSQSGIAQVINGTTIPAGRVSSLVYVATGATAGFTNVTALVSLALLNSQSSGYSASSAVINTVIPAPSKIAAFVFSPISILSRSGGGPSLTIQLQDQNGNPARARQITGLTITSSDNTVLNKTLSATVSTGKDYVTIPLFPSNPGNTVLTVSTQGLSPASVQAEFISYPLKVALLPSSLSILINGTSKLTLVVTLDGQGLQKVRVDWKSTLGTMTPSNSTTGPLGTAISTFKPSGTGVSTVAALYSSPVLGNANQTLKIIISPLPVIKKAGILDQFLGFQILGFPYGFAMIGAIAGVAVVGVLFIRRRRGRGKKEEEGTSEEEMDIS
jgi:hypothetical protein